MKTYKTKIEEDDLVYKYLPVTHTGSFAADCETDKDISIEDLTLSIWYARSPMMKKLFQLRRLMVKPFGIKVNIEPEKVENCIRNQVDYNTMSVPDKTKDALLIRVDDKHMTIYFNLRIMNRDKKVKTFKLSSAVKIKNIFGFFYYFAIFPFHHFVMVSLFKRGLKKML